MKWLFPYERVEKNSRIIIYGVGDVGRSYLQQLKENSYCKIIFSVDSYAELPHMRIHDTLVYWPNKINEVSEDNYDYIVISVVDAEQINFIYNNLKSMNVPDNKIIKGVIDTETKFVALDTPYVRPHFRPTFSWFGEDLLVYGIFKILGIEKPTYLDVGCNHPYVGNNTAYFYLSGSKGINIDANINCIKLMEEERPDDQNLCMGVLTTEGAKKFYMLGEMEALNSFSEEYINKHQEDHSVENDFESSVSSIEIECHTLQYIIENYCNEKFPDYFDLDIEGMDDDVIESYDFSKNGPWIICVESHSERVNKKLISDGYFRYFKTKHNSIFLKKSILDILVLQ